MKKSTPSIDRPFVALGATASEPDILYATGFDAPDPVAVIFEPGKKPLLLVNEMEFGRARNQARGCDVGSATSLGLPGEARRGVAQLLRCTLAARGICNVNAAATFPFGAAEVLRKAGIAVNLVGASPVAKQRAVKRPDEISKIAASQRIARKAERAIGRAIKDCEARKDGVLLRNGRPFTSEEARNLVRRVLLENGAMDMEGTIVAGGVQATDPHEAGHGPLRSGQWIVCDIFPRHLSTGYWGDMTRTFMHGRPKPELKRLYDTVAKAQKLGLSLVRPGVSGDEVHNAVADFFVSQGYHTGTGADGRPFGFFHGLGHGVGLEIHEEPRLSLRGGMLEEGMVVTVEPGLYLPELGGVRIEDTVVVTATGCRIL